MLKIVNIDRHDVHINTYLTFSILNIHKYIINFFINTTYETIQMTDNQNNMIT